MKYLQECSYAPAYGNILINNIHMYVETNTYIEAPMHS